MSEYLTVSLKAVDNFCRKRTVRLLFIGGTLGWATFSFTCSHTVRIGQVNGRSMQPTFNPGLAKPYEQSTHPILMLDRIKSAFSPCYDWVLLRPVRYDDLNLKPGEIVTLVNPIDSNSRDIKRVIATEGQTVVTRSYKNAVVVVPKGHIWVEGDNSGVSKDSNRYGPIPVGLVICRATHILMPLRRAGRLDTTTIPFRPSREARGLVDVMGPAES